MERTDLKNNNLQLPVITTLNSAIEIYNKHPTKIFPENGRYVSKRSVPLCLREFWVDPSNWSFDLESKEDYQLLYYSVRRFHNQLNEAQNKLWATLELVNLKNTGTVCKQFSLDFSNGTLIPTLYYSQVSVMIAFMSLFGVVSMYPSDQKGKPKSYNLIRTSSGWKIYERKQYANTFLKIKKADGWHEQVLSLYENLKKLGVGLPNLDLQKINDLRKKRNNYHYQILGDTSMEKVYSDSLDTYFTHLSDCFKNLEEGIEIVKQIKVPDTRIVYRFDELKKFYESIYLTRNPKPSKETDKTDQLSDVEGEETHGRYTKQDLELIGLEELRYLR